MSTTTQIIQTLNAAWRDIQRRNPDVPDVMIVTGRRRHKSESNIRGQHCRDTWHVDGCDDRQAEVWISGERLAEGGREVMQTLIHEAAHALARTRDLTDTSNKNRYHNKIFVGIAEELGLEGPEASAGPAIGYSNCTIPDVTARMYASTIESLDEACKNFVAPALIEEEQKTRKPTIKAFCECPEGDNDITWSKKYQKKFEETGFLPLLCATCRQPFTPEDDPEEK